MLRHSRILGATERPTRFSSLFATLSIVNAVGFLAYLQISGISPSSTQSVGQLHQFHSMQSLLPVGLGGTQDTTYRFRERPALQAGKPLVERSAAFRSRNSVILPAPELPRMAITSPFRTDRDTLSKGVYRFTAHHVFFCRHPRADSSFQKSSVSGCLAQGVVAGIYGPNIPGRVKELQYRLFFRRPLIQLQHGVRECLCHPAT